MDAEEDRLRFALLAAAPDGRREFSTEAVQRAILDIPGVLADDFAIRRFAPESSLIVFSSQRSRDAALSAGSIRVDGAELFFRPWTRLVRAESRPLRQRVSLEIEGIPAHAWSVRTARKLLASSCWIERLEPASEDRSDMSFMALTAWTDDPSLIPRRKLLVIAEHERPVVHEDPVTQRIFANTRPYLREKKALQYEVLIHLRSIADFNSRTPSPSPGPSPPSTDGDSGPDGNPDRRYGQSRGDGGPRLQGFPPVYGREDGTTEQLGGAGETAGSHDRTHGASRQSRRRDVRASSSPPSGNGRRYPAASPTASPARPTSAQPAAKGSVTAAAEPPASPADATKALCHEKRTEAMPPVGQRGAGQFLSAEQTSGNSPFPKRATDKPAAATERISCETVAFEVQIPCRPVGVVQAADPMIFEFRATRQAHRFQKLPDAPRVGLRTYHRRPRSAAATDATEAALPTVSSDLAKEGGPSDSHSPGPAQLESGPQHSHTTLKRARPRQNDTNEASNSSGKQARLQLQPELVEAKAATAAFLASVSRALQAPLASLPPRLSTTSPTTTPRRSSRLASKPLNTTVRASKKGEVLVLRKLGLRPDDDNSTDTSRQLASVFHGPLDTTHFVSLRDIFPAARALSDMELMAAAAQASQAACAC
ncbi:unnamed protein product [Urochloa humidicola]